MQNSRCALTKRAVVLNICTLKFIAYFYFMQISIPLCVTHNCGLHYSRPNYVSSTFKVGQGELPVILDQM